MVPAVTLDVAPAPNAALATPSPSAPPTLAKPAPAPGAPPPEGDAPRSYLRDALARVAPYAWPIAIAGAVLAAFGTVSGLLWRRFGARRAQARRMPARPHPKTARLQPARGQGATPSRANVPKSAAEAEQALVKACRTGDASAAHGALMAWMRLSGKPADDFRTPAMAAAVGDLQAALYGADAGRWKGRALMSAFRSEQRARLRGARRAKASRLVPLYPGS